MALCGITGASPMGLGSYCEDDSVAGLTRWWWLLMGALVPFRVAPSTELLELPLSMVMGSIVIV